MKTWLRLTLVAATVGGGFTAIADIWSHLFSVSGVSLLLNLILLGISIFIFLSGLLLVHNPNRTLPVTIALALQIPVFSSPIVAVQIACGLFAAAGITISDQLGVFGAIRLGYQYQIQYSLINELPWHFGINVFPTILLIALVRQTVKDRPNS